MRENGSEGWGFALLLHGRHGDCMLQDQFAGLPCPESTARHSIPTDGDRPPPHAALQSELAQQEAENFAYRNRLQQREAELEQREAELEQREAEVQEKQAGLQQGVQVTAQGHEASEARLKEREAALIEIEARVRARAARLHDWSTQLTQSRSDLLGRLAAIQDWERSTTRWGAASLAARENWVVACVGVLTKREDDVSRQERGAGKQLAGVEVGGGPVETAMVCGRGRHGSRRAGSGGMIAAQGPSQPVAHEWAWIHDGQSVGSTCCAWRCGTPAACPAGAPAVAPRDPRPRSPQPRASLYPLRPRPCWNR